MMADVKWIKLSTGLFDNRKIKQIERMPEGDTLVIIWLKLLVLAGNVNDGGFVYFTREIPYTEQLLAAEFNRPLTVVQLALDTFVRFGMIEIIEDIIHISNWEKYQNVEWLDKIREQTRQRVANFRERKRLECNVTSNVTVTQGNAPDIDIELDKEQEVDKSITRKRFTPPSVEEVSEYCRERANHVDADRFVNYYASKGWKVGNTPMKDWKAAVRTWEQRDKQGASGKPNTALQYEQRSYTQDELDGMYADLSRYE